MVVMSERMRKAVKVLEEATDRLTRIVGDFEGRPYSTAEMRDVGVSAADVEAKAAFVGSLVEDEIGETCRPAGGFRIDRRDVSPGEVGVPVWERGERGGG